MESLIRTLESGKDLALKAFDGNEYNLSATTWRIKVSRPERQHLRHNFHKIQETLKEPDEVRQSQKDAGCFIAYKRFDLYWVLPQVRAPAPPGQNWFAVVADRKRKVIKTFFPTRSPKPGVRLWPTKA